MNLLQLTRKNVAGSAFRSSIVALCACLMAALALGASLILLGAEDSLRLANRRLGADILVVPEGTVGKVEGALLMGHTTRVWMPAENVAKVAAVPGVEAASPQLYLSTLSNASCCSVPDMFLVAYDPQTDFTIQPWLKDRLGGGLSLGEVVGGHYVFTPEGEQNIKVYGYLVTLKANMEPTGTALDQTMFLQFDTARDIARVSQTAAQAPLELPDGSVSAVMVRLQPGADPHAVALEIMHRVPGVAPVTSPDLFQSYRRQMTALRAGLGWTMGLTLVLSLGLIALVFSMAANERRRELGVLRAMGASRGFVFRSLLLEAGLLAAVGAAGGIALTVAVTNLFRRLIVTTLGVPFLMPSAASLAVEVAGGLAVALIVIVLAAVVPAYRISHLDPALAMRE